MRAWIKTLWDAILFRTEAYQRLADRRDAFMHGFVVIVVVALLAGLPGFVTQFVGGLRPTATEIGDAQAGFRQAMGMITPYLAQAGVPAEMQAQILQQAQQGMDMGLEIAGQIQDLPTTLPRPVGKTLEAAGAWAARPFGSASFPLSAAVLATWLGYGIWVMLAARLMGGRGGLTSFFGATALFAVPHVLDFFRWVPYVGSALGVIAFVWGAAVYVKATAVSHRFSVGHGLLAVLLPLLVAVFLGILLVLGVGVIVLIAAAGGN
jgi:hypothetical protein